MTKLRLSNVAICYRNGHITKVLKFIADHVAIHGMTGMSESEIECNEILATCSHNRNVVEVMNCNARSVYVVKYSTIVRVLQRIIRLILLRIHLVVRSDVSNIINLNIER